jgi:hypothetical protein
MWFAGRCAVGPTIALPRCFDAAVHGKVRFDEHPHPRAGTMRHGSAGTVPEKID